MPRAVAARNPHGGEGGNFGEEEVKIIGRACEQARRSGRAVDGPIPADSVFHQALQGRDDGILAQFHDQGHIAGTGKASHAAMAAAYRVAAELAAYTDRIRAGYGTRR